MLLHSLHFTRTDSPSRRVNLLEPHFGQIGHALSGFISAQWVLYLILLLSLIGFLY